MSKKENKKNTKQCKIGLSLKNKTKITKEVCEKLNIPIEDVKITKFNWFDDIMEE